MYQLIYSIVITLLVAGCAVQHETISVKQKVLAYIHQEIKDPEKVEQIEAKINAMSEKEVIELLNQIDSEKNIQPERQHWNEIYQQVETAYQSGHYSQGIEFAEKAYQYALKNFGETDSDTLASINNLAELYRSQGRYGKAEPLYKRCLQLTEEVLGPKHSNTLTSINNLAVLYYSQGSYGEAEPLYKRCLQLREEVLGPKHPSTLQSINNLAGLYESQGRYGEAEPLYKRCLQLREEVLRPKHPDTLTSINNLAALYESQGRYGEAEPLYKRCLQLREEVLGPKHPGTLTSINNLALLYDSQGRYGEAEPIYKRCLQLNEEVLGPKHPHTLASINNLAALYESQGRYGEAEPLYKRCLQLSEEALLANHPQTLASINNLAGLYRSQGRYGEAEPLYKRCLRLKKEVLGPKHPDTLRSINNLAFLYESQGRYGEAEPLYKRCLQLSEEVLGPKHPDTLSILLNYSACLVMLKQDNQALLHLKKLELSLRHYAGDMLKTTQQLRVRRKFMMSKSNFQDVLFTLAFQSNNPSIQAFAGDVILRWKCVQEEAETIMNRMVHSSQDPRIIQLGKTINGLRQQMSVFNPKADMNSLIQELEQQEVKLAQLSNAYQHYLNKSNVRMDDLKLMLPSKTAVIELKQYQHVNFKAYKLEDMHLAAALILPNAERIILEDLGPRKEILAIFEKVRNAKTQQGKTPALKQLYSKLFGVFDPHIAQAETIYISPDGLTHQIAFSRLILPDGRFWVQRQTLCRIQTSRDLMDQNKTIGNQGTLVAMGGIDFDHFPDIKITKSDQKTADAATHKSIQRMAKRNEAFKPLPFSKKEIQQIAPYYQARWKKTPQLFKETNASEYQIKHLDTPPHVLHLSTHGFYLSASEDRAERPMMLSGLALAGSNLGLKGKRDTGNEDGILFAIEVAGLNLSGTELVVLSACDTGKGAIDYSEGVYGLLRAFRLAGAHDVMMTLWPLYDQSSSEFLSQFYQTWLGSAKMTPSNALRQTQLSFIKQNKDSTLWAPYVMVGGKLQ
jgi:CHAT domain-containing protein/Flp pilus assembly protein TadD